MDRSQGNYAEWKKKRQYKRLYVIDSIYIEFFLKVYRWEQMSDLQELDVVGREMEVMVKGRCGTFVGMIDWSYGLVVVERSVPMIKLYRNHIEANFKNQLRMRNLFCIKLLT